MKQRMHFLYIHCHSYAVHETLAGHLVNPSTRMIINSSSLSGLRAVRRIAVAG
jgi:hypothetical protein